MKIYKTNLNGVFKIKLEPFTDFRGKYLELFNKSLFKKINKGIRFVQDDISISKNVLRGIHGDNKTSKLITCLYGKFVLVVIITIKQANSTESIKNLSYQTQTIFKYLFQKIWKCSLCSI